MTTSDRWPKDKIRYDLSVYFPSLELTCVTPGKTDLKTMSNHTRVNFPNIYTEKLPTFSLYFFIHTVCDILC